MNKSAPAFDGSELATASIDGVAIIDESEIVRANEALADVHGYESADDLVAEDWERLYEISEEDQSIDELLEHVHQNGEWRGSATGRRRKGSDVPVELSLCATDDFVVSVVKDISERKEREKRLERLETIVDGLDDGVYVLDEDLRLDTANERFFQLLEQLGISREEARTMRAPDLVPREEDRAALEAAIDRAIESKPHTDSFELSAELPNGDRIVCESRFRLYPEPRGEHRGCIGILRDITERKKRERELREAQQFNEELVLNAPFSIVRIDEEFNITYVNPRTEEITGLPEGKESEALGVDIRELSSVAATGEAHRLTPLKEGETVEFEFPFQSIYGREVYLTGRGMPVMKDGEFDGAVLMAVDISERRQQERALERQRDELDTLNQINELLLEVARDLFESPVQGDIERTVCERLVDSDLYQFAWIGKPEMGSNRLVSDAVVGIDDNYVEPIAVTDESATGQGPVVQAFRTGTLKVNQDVHSDSTAKPWREAADERNVQSMAAVPLAYEGTTYGVLTVYASRPLAFSQREQRGFEMLGEATGYAINASRTRRLLFAEQVVELEFQFTGAGESIISATDRLDGTVTLEGYLSTRNGSWLTYFSVPEGDAERFAELAREESAVESVRLVGDGPEQVVAMTISSSLLDEIAALGGRVTSATIDGGRGTVVVEVPQSTDIGEFVEQIRSIYPGAELTAKRDEARPVEQLAWLSDDGPPDLTERQREALEAAYLSGYFDWPRESNAEEVAEMLGVSRPTLQAHLRKAERKLLSTFLDSAEQDVVRIDR